MACSRSHDLEIELGLAKQSFPRLFVEILLTMRIFRSSEFLFDCNITFLAPLVNRIGKEKTKQNW